MQALMLVQEQLVCDLKICGYVCTFISVTVMLWNALG